VGPVASTTERMGPLTNAEHESAKNICTYSRAAFGRRARFALAGHAALGAGPRRSAGAAAEGDQSCQEAATRWPAGQLGSEFLYLFKAKSMPCGPRHGPEGTSLPDRGNAQSLSSESRQEPDELARGDQSQRFE